MLLLKGIQELLGATKKIHYSCEGRIEKSVPRDHRLSSLGKPLDASRDPRDRFSYPILTLLIDSYILTTRPLVKSVYQKK